MSWDDDEEPPANLAEFSQRYHEQRENPDDYREQPEILGYEKASLLVGLKFNTVNTLCWENGEEIFCQIIVIRITAS